MSQDTATYVSGRGVAKAIVDPNTRISVALDGVVGDGTRSRVMTAVMEHASGRGTGFHEEMYMLYKGDALSQVDFYEGGQLLENPFS